MRSRVWVVLSFLFFLPACGQVVKETVTPISPEFVNSAGIKVVILPFADYTPDTKIEEYLHRNILVSESLEDQFNRHGIMPAIGEDVVAYLIDRGIIRLPETPVEDSEMTKLLASEMNNTWSDAMKSEIMDVVYQNRARDHRESGETPSGKSFHMALTTKKVVEIGRTFDADYIVRGRLVEYEEGNAKDSFNPFQIGILPFFFNTSSRTVFGVAKSDEYELYDKMAIGALGGLALGSSNKNSPIDESVETTETVHPLFDPVVTSTTDYHALNTFIWSAAGAGAAYLAHNSGKVPRALVQLRMIVQEASSGRVVWTNRSEVEVVPETFFAQQEYRYLVAGAIRKATTSLVENFVATCEKALVKPPAEPLPKADPPSGTHHDYNRG